MDTLMKHNISLGSLATCVKTFSGQCMKCINDVKARFVNKVNCQAENEGNCCITGITIISEAEILLADFANKSLKVLNYRDDIEIVRFSHKHYHNQLIFCCNMFTK
jgi:hypothetical protein